MKHSSASQTGGWGRNQVFSESISPSWSAPLTGANSEQSATSRVFRDRSDRESLQGRVISIQLLHRFLLSSSNAPRFECDLAGIPARADPAGAQSRECHDDLSPSSSRDPLRHGLQFHRASSLSLSGGLCASGRCRGLAKSPARLTKRRSLPKDFRRLSTRFDSVQDVGPRSG